MPKEIKTEPATPEASASKRSRPKRHVTRPTKKEQADILERQILVYELVKNGLSLHKVSKYLKENGFKGSSVATVSNDFQARLADRRQHVLNRSVDEYLTMAIDTTFDLLASVAPRARKFGKREDIDSVRNLWKDLDRYTQFSKAQQAESASKEALIKFLGFDPEAVSNANDSAGA